MHILGGRRGGQEVQRAQGGSRLGGGEGRGGEAVISFIDEEAVEPRASGGVGEGWGIGVHHDNLMRGMMQATVKWQLSSENEEEEKGEGAERLTVRDEALRLSEGEARIATV